MARRIRSQDFNGNIFFTSDFGVLKSQSPTTAYGPAGVPQGLDLILTLPVGAGYLQPQHAVSYRLVWGIKDINNNYIYGAPSSRAIIKNTTAGALNVNVAFTIPDFITTSHFFQIYRSVQVDSNGAATYIIDPGDELYLVYERNPTAAEIAARAVTTAVDSQDESLVTSSTPLYTNSTQEGIINSNYAPPYCRDLCLYKDHMIYANTKNKQTLGINLIGTTAPGPTITIAGVTYTSAGAENIAAGQFLMQNAALPTTPSMNIEATAKSLCRVINGYALNTRVYAYYVSDFDELPGKIRLESRVYGDTAWSVTVSAGFEPFWEPQIQTTATALFTSTDDDTANSILISKLQQPEHVPYINQFFVGAKNEAIERVIALRDSVIIIKTNSIWRLVGSSIANFQISLLDNTVSIVSRDSAATLNNVIYALTNQGFISIGDNGVQIVGRQIEADILADVRYMIANSLTDEPVGIGHESDRAYYCTITATADQPIYTSGKRITYVYNAFSQAWTRHYYNANCYAVLDDRLVYGLNNNFGIILKQRIGYADQTATFPAEMEFCDPSGTLNITAINAGANQVTATFTDGVNWTGSIDSWPTTVQRGWIILDQANSRKYIVLAVNGNTYTLNTTTGLAVGNYTIYRSIKMRPMLAPRTYDQPFQLKQFSESHFDFGTMSAYEFDVYFYNEEDVRDEPISTYFTAQTTQTRIALNDFVTTTLNANYVPHNIKRTYVHKDRAVNTRLFVEIVNQVAGSRFEINAVGLDVRPFKSNKVSQ